MELQWPTLGRVAQLRAYTCVDQVNDLKHKNLWGTNTNKVLYKQQLFADEGFELKLWPGLPGKITTQ